MHGEEAAPAIVDDEIPLPPMRTPIQVVRDIIQRIRTTSQASDVPIPRRVTRGLRRVPGAIPGWLYGLLGESDLPAWPRFKRAMKRAPVDLALERAAWPGMVFDGIFVPTLLAIFGMGALGQVLLADWIAGEIPGVINFVRAVWHQAPNAKPEEWWKRDWTYWSRPGARQDKSLGLQPRKPMETDPKTPWRPLTLRRITRQAKRHGRHSPWAFFDDWLNQRSRIVNWTIEHVFVAVGLVTHVPLTRLFVSDNFVVTRVPDFVGWPMSIVNGDVTRTTRSEWYQREGDVIVQVDTPADPSPGGQHLRRLENTPSQSSVPQQTSIRTPEIGATSQQLPPRPPTVSPDIGL